MRDRTFWPVVTCFLLSGFAALIYQTAWTREFAFVFGTSELAVATVLAAYMGGLALGAWIASRFVRRVRRPVRVYGLLEAGIALAAIAVPFAIRGATALYVALLGSQPDLPPSDGAGHALYFLASSFAILLVPTALMGATLPLLARHAVHTRSQIGSRIGALYATNTAGAVAGTLCAAFWLLPAYGLRATVAVAVAANVLVFAIAALVARSARPPSPIRTSRAGRAPFHWILPAILLSGAVSFAYEVFWFRLLGHVLGGSVHAFSTMLASFLIGIALGSAAAARAATDGDARAARLRARAARDRGALGARLPRARPRARCRRAADAHARAHRERRARRDRRAAAEHALHRRHVPVRGAHPGARSRGRERRDRARLRVEHDRRDRRVARARASS